MFYDRVSSRETFNNMAKFYDWHTKLSWAAPKQTALNLAPYLSTFSNDNGPVQILDIGIGTGQLVEEIQKNTGTLCAEFSGVDISEDMLEKCKTKSIAKQLDIVDLNTTPLPHVRNNFDAVVSSGVFEFLPNVDNAIQEMSRVTKEKGYVVFTVEKPRSSYLKIMEAISSGLYTALTLHKPKMPQNYTHTPHTIEKALEDNDLKLLAANDFRAYGNSLTGAVNYTVYVSQKLG